MDNSPDDGPCEVTITAPDRDWLQAFVRQLVEDRLAAAAHVDMMHSTYRWAGEVKESDEARGILHTVFAAVPLIVRRTREQHPFEVAAVVATPIVGGSENYINWVREAGS